MSFQKNQPRPSSAKHIADRLAAQSAGGLLFTLTAGGLPPETFVVAAFSLNEAFSTPFNLAVSLASADPAIDFAAVLDTRATLTILRAGKIERTVTGMVASFVQGNTGKHQTRYEMTVRPDMWRTTLRQNSRIFQQQDIKTILTTLLKESGVRDVVFRLRYPHPEREFCVQYRETDFDFPGRFKDEQHGADFTRYRLEALRNNALTGYGESNDAAMQPGVLFTLTDHPRDDLNQLWQLVSVAHSGRQPQALAQSTGESGTVMSNHFTFIPTHQHWRPMPTLKPVINGSQIAKVVGPAGEEIFCDKYGRIRLQFLWDRYGQSDDHSSCWIRVT
ncbi:type VI secretion system tip protein TssI/VgrG, partial [Photorhabdus sp. RM323S]|uniref:type VI secretion system tip protein TssI/VgrG n=1 Tax=Photorhabdus sp. RM323S TaxID=3342828 RepID=UPI0036DF9DF6